MEGWEQQQPDLDDALNELSGFDGKVSKVGATERAVSEGHL